MRSSSRPDDVFARRHPPVSAPFDEVGATGRAARAVIGDRLGLCRARAGALTPGQLASRTGTAERYVGDGLNANAAGATSSINPMAHKA